MRNPILAAILTLILLSLACGQYVTPTPAVSAVEPTPSPLPATPTRRAVPSATAEADVQTIAVVRQPVVNVRKAAGGDPTGEYVYAGQEVAVLETATIEGGEWVRIADPEGWIFAGCLEGSQRGCIAE
jgi:SH3-like domain-containing protein